MHLLPCARVSWYALALTTQLQRLDPQDQVGGSVVVDLAERMREEFTHKNRNFYARRYQTHHPQNDFFQFFTSNPMAQFQRISAAAAIERLAQHPEAQLLDIRARGRFLIRTHSRRRLFHPRPTPLMAKRLSKDTPILIYCYHGNASQTFAQFLLIFALLRCLASTAVMNT